MNLESHVLKFLGFAGSFLLGSFPTGYILGKCLRGIDIREHGSGNPGATNVFRVVGIVPGCATLLIDGAKGFLPVYIALRILPGNLVFASVIGLAAIAGHNWSPFLSFRGGKGVATSAGVFLALLPVPALIALAVFVAAMGLSRHVSVGSMIAAVALPIATWFWTASRFMTALTTFCAILVLFLHKKNILQLMRGQESKAPFLGKQKI